MLIIAPFLFSLFARIHASPVATPPKSGDACYQLPIRVKKFDENSLGTRSHSELSNPSFSNSFLSKRATMQLPYNSHEVYQGRGISATFAIDIFVGGKRNGKDFGVVIDTTDKNLMLFSQLCDEDENRRSRPENQKVGWYVPPPHELQSQGARVSPPPAHGLGYEGAIYKDDVEVGELKFEDYEVFAATKLTSDLLSYKYFGEMGIFGLSRGSEVKKLLRYVALDFSNPGSVRKGLIHLGCLGSSKNFYWVLVLNPSQHEEWRLPLPHDILVQADPSRSKGPGKSLTTQDAHTAQGYVILETAIPTITLDLDTATNFHNSLRRCEQSEHFITGSPIHYWICDCNLFTMTVMFGQVSIVIPSTKLLVLTSRSGRCRTMIEAYDSNTKQWSFGAPFFELGYFAFDYKLDRVGMNP